MADTSKVRNQLATKVQGGEVATAGERPVTMAEMVRQSIARQTEAFAQVLPASVSPERFSRLVLTAVKATPDLLQCFGTVEGQKSMLSAAMQAAGLGLEPNTPIQDCWLLPRKIQGTWEAQLSIGYRGLLKLAKRSGRVLEVDSVAVRERDEFRWSRGLENDLFWKSADGDRGELTHAYALARLTNGGKPFEVLNRTQVEARRAMSDSWKSDRARPFSPWTNWPEAMWRKTAIRALIPSLDLTPEAEHAIARDDSRWTITDDGVLDVAVDETDDGPSDAVAPAGTDSGQALAAEPGPEPGAHGEVDRG